MAITINGTGSITGLSAGGLPDSSITSDDIAANAVTEAKLASGLYACKAWVNFNGTGTIAIRGSGNVSSITDGGVGSYRVNFTNAMPDTNYCSVVSGSDIGYGTVPSLDAANTGYLPFYTFNNYATGNGDPSIVCVAIFR